MNDKKKEDIVLNQILPHSDIENLLKTRREELLQSLPQANSKQLDRLIKSFLLEFKNNENLKKCSPASLFIGLLRISQLGLEFGNEIGHAYLVPFFNSKTKLQEVKLIVGYKGLIELARRSGGVKSIQARIVKEGDVFECSYGTNPKIKHEPKFREKAKVTHVYALAVLEDKLLQFDVMTYEEVEAVRRLSKSSGAYSPWVTNYEEMAKKTILRRLLKTLPTTIDLKNSGLEYLEEENYYNEYRNSPQIYDSIPKGNKALSSILL